METKDNTLSEAMTANYMQSDLTLRIWQATKSDRIAADELAASKGADKHAVGVTKRLLEGNKELKACVAAYGRIRTWFYANSLSMGNSLYVVPVNTAMKFLAEFDKLKREADEARDELIDSYDDAINAAKLSLGTMFDATNYPSKQQVGGMFSASLDMRPVPAAIDYDRIAIPARLAAGLKQVYSRKAQQHADAAVEDLQEKLLGELDRMAVQFGKVAKGEKTRLYQSLITNMQGLVELARGLGAIDGGRLSSLADDIEAKLLVTNKVGDFKDNASLARSVSDSARALVERISGPLPVDTDTPDDGGQVDSDTPDDGGQVDTSYDDEVDKLVAHTLDGYNDTEEVSTNDDSDSGKEISTGEVNSDFDFESVFYD